MGIFMDELVDNKNWKLFARSSYPRAKCYGRELNGGFGRAIYLSRRCVYRPGDVTRLSSYYRPYYDSCTIKTELSLQVTYFN